MNHLKLSQHKFNKGKFSTDFIEFFNKMGKSDHWFYGRMPEYLWIGFILNKYGRENGLSISLCGRIMLLLKKTTF